MTVDEGKWTVDAVDGAEVRLRSGRIGLMSVDVSAPVSSGDLAVGSDDVQFRLTLALDRLKTNFVMQSAARSLIKRNDAHSLVYEGTGPTGVAPWRVSGTAVCGDINVELSLTITPVGAPDSMSEIELRGSANLGTVHLPLPGLGTVDDFSFDVDARLSLRVESV